MRKRILLWTSVLLLMAMLSGCTLAQPEAASTAGNGTGDTFCGFWLIYDRWENEDSHVFDVGSDTEQMLLGYRLLPKDGAQEPAFTSKTGSSIGDAETKLNYKDESEEAEIKGVIYLIRNEDQSAQEQGYREIWLQGDVVQSFRDAYIEPPEGMNQQGMAKPGETMIVYIPQEQIDEHGMELKEIAEKAGVRIILKSESPRQLKIVSVYQRPDGTIYADEGGAHTMWSNDGCSYSQTVENAQTINGKTTKKKVTATISVQMIDKLKTVRLVEMDSQDVTVRTTEVTLADLQRWSQQQKSFPVGKDSAYLMVEETYETAQGNSYVRRTVYNPPTANEYANLLHTFHFPVENGLTETAYVNITF